MKKIIMLASVTLSSLLTLAQLPSIIDVRKYPAYYGKDLGLTYESGKFNFRIWSPIADAAELRLYTNGEGGAAIQTTKMTKEQQGSWKTSVSAAQKGKFYTFRVQINGQWLDEVPDPYAKAVGINGKRAQIVDMKETNPANWVQDKPLAAIPATDAIIYELHVRDASIAASSGIKQKGKFVGLTEKGTRNTAGLSTGLDHLKDLGVTHIHLLPSYDFSSVDESQPDQKYNWGYDPLNYNTPEGSYSTNPKNGITRIKEFKQLIQTLHESGLRVVMDVVYNHTGLTEKSNFNQLVPGYYYRQTADGSLSNATACGNETASERQMVRKFISESMQYWVKEYHIDGFRVDLMGVHDIETMNLISKELNQIKPGILIYGEGWTAGASPLPDSLRALKKNVSKLDHIAVFSDDIRDGIKGSVFDHNDRGFASGKPGMEESVKFGIVASCPHPQVDYSRVNYSKAPYSIQPYQTVTYAECHDNHVLWDKLAVSAADATEEQRVNMHKLALSIVLTSQGISFLHAGTEFLRTKKGVENSFESPDDINAIDWDLKTKNKAVYDYVQALIALRKAHPAFHMKTAEQIKANLRFVSSDPGVIAYTLNGFNVNDPWKKILVCFNGSANDKRVIIGEGSWKKAIENNKFNDGVFEGKSIKLAPFTCSILFQN